ncbi:hypothetical protein [Oscillatoria acuminata]|uniref:hypothetical protein n=1 Tax=Oscillatoria acuminata TaxID=118323 RepID=UPI0002EF05A0|nr:hypothetical protein [Oscillatoria acuminata]
MATSFFGNSSRFAHGLIVGSPFPWFGHDNHFIPGPVAIARGVFSSRSVSPPILGSVKSILS